MTHSIDPPVTFAFPKNYFRVACTIESLCGSTPSHAAVPQELILRLRVGDGVLLSEYDAVTTTGLVHHLAICSYDQAGSIKFSWRPVRAEIWVDTTFGRKFWLTLPGFRFADSKITDYGLNHIFAEHFPMLPDPTDLSEPGRRRKAQKLSHVAEERLQPIEVVGEPGPSIRGGYVYVLKSAYGYKVGRTRNLPQRMRAFGVKLPFLYSIQLCAWFDDHIEAENSYHKAFSAKRINGEWFDLSDEDIDNIRNRRVG